MSRGMTIADFVQQVLYAIYKVRLDVSDSVDGNFHSKSDKFKEVVMEANMVLQELQKDADWNWLRERWEMGIAHSHHGDVQEFELPDWMIYNPQDIQDALQKIRNLPESFREDEFMVCRERLFKNRRLDEFEKRTQEIFLQIFQE